MENTTTIVKLKKALGPYATYAGMLSDFIKPIPRTKKGERYSFTILKPLPTVEEFQKMLRERFTTTIGSLISDAFNIFQELASELDEWYNNLPDAFRDGDKGSQIQDAQQILEGLQEPDVEEELAKIQVFVLPALDAYSRSKRCAEACEMLRTVVDELGEFQNTDDDDPAEKVELAEAAGSLAGELDDAINEAENVEFPVMYS
jgi:hypothetical protein